MDSWDQTGYNISNAYSFPLCQTFCHSQAIIANCSCNWPEFFLPEEIVGVANFTRACNISSGSRDVICKKATIKQFDSLERKCPCEVACHDRNFQSQISSS